MQDLGNRRPKWDISPAELIAVQAVESGALEYVGRIPRAIKARRVDIYVTGMRRLIKTVSAYATHSPAPRSGIALVPCGLWSVDTLGFMHCAASAVS